ncbi:GspH/FimT family pseudopilin [uncultured Amphritea sp.]|uniref:GspH/FimT family pseudopilin n=1 Tax=uncultured Amphritea sp. TaxID=981605 RepID=UPI0026180C84|nr:GspH/FimT family pseudopilin [uncultured Amphritea sp.]
MINRAEQGFTLIELMVALSILVILLTIGVPSLIGFVHAQKMDSAVQLLKDSYNQARYEAVTRHQSVTLCPLDSATNQCGNVWGGGVLLYIDQDGDSLFDKTKDLRLKQVGFSDGVTITTKSRTQITISSAGTTFDTDTFKITVSGSEDIKNLTISSAGRIKLG